VPGLAMTEAGVPGGDLCARGCGADRAYRPVPRSPWASCHPGTTGSDPAATDGDDGWLSFVRVRGPGRLRREPHCRRRSGATDSSPNCTRNRRSVAPGRSARAILHQGQ
jgi:hypothetical protein